MGPGKKPFALQKRRRPLGDRPMDLWDPHGPVFDQETPGLRPPFETNYKGVCPQEKQKRHILLGGIGPQKGKTNGITESNSEMCFFRRKPEFVGCLSLFSVKTTKEGGTSSKQDAPKFVVFRVVVFLLKPQKKAHPQRKITTKHGHQLQIEKPPNLNMCPWNPGKF